MRTQLLLFFDQPELAYQLPVNCHGSRQRNSCPIHNSATKYDSFSGIQSSDLLFGEVVKKILSDGYMAGRLEKTQR
jgi:hypothetical protein